MIGKIKLRINTFLALSLLCIALCFFVNATIKHFQLAHIIGKSSRAKATYSDVWRLKPSSQNSPGGGAGNFYLDIDFFDVHTNSIIDTIGNGIAFNTEMIDIRTTPLISDFPYNKSVFYMLDAWKTSYPSFFSLLTMSKEQFASLSEKIAYKVSTGSETTLFYGIEKGDVVGCAYLQPIDRKAFITLDSGSTNLCLTIYLAWRKKLTIKEIVVLCKNMIENSYFM